MGRLYLGLFLRTLTSGLQIPAFKAQFTLFLAPSFSLEAGYLSLPFLVVALLSFVSLVNLEGLGGFPLVDPQWSSPESYLGVWSYF